MTCYYTLASLPALSPEGLPHLTWEDFLDRISSELSQEDQQFFQTLGALGLEASLETSDFSRTFVKNYGLVFQFFAWEKDLRLQLAQMRARDLSWQIDGLEGDKHYFLEEELKAVLSVPGPMERERAMDQLRWAILENWGKDEFYTLEALGLYALKLLIQLKQAKWTEDAGRAELDRCHEAIITRLGD